MVQKQGKKGAEVRVAGARWQMSTGEQKVLSGLGTRRACPETGMPVNAAGEPLAMVLIQKRLPSYGCSEVLRAHNTEVESWGLQALRDWIPRVQRVSTDH